MELINFICYLSPSSFVGKCWKRSHNLVFCPSSQDTYWNVIIKIMRQVLTLFHSYPIFKGTPQHMSDSPLLYLRSAQCAHLTREAPPQKFLFGFWQFLLKTNLVVISFWQYLLFLKKSKYHPNNIFHSHCQISLESMKNWVPQSTRNTKGWWLNLCLGNAQINTIFSEVGLP